MITPTNIGAGETVGIDRERLALIDWQALARRLAELRGEVPVQAVVLRPATLTRQPRRA